MLRINSVLFIVLITACVGCVSIPTQESKALPCSEEWVLLVEEKFPTGDGQGHGPDFGSLEWRSVIEFKLGIRGDTRVPSLESEQWCKYIHENYIKNAT